jgi:hypothetical protein
MNGCQVRSVYVRFVLLIEVTSCEFRFDQVS